MAYAISPATQLASEGVGTITFTITRTLSALAETLFVSTTPDQGFANAGDYLGLLNQSVSFLPGETTRVVTLSVTDDSLAETNETFGIIVQQFASDPASVFLAKSTFTIQDNDAPPPATTYAITPGATTVNEAAGTVTFTITRSSAALSETVFVSTTPDQGFANIGDYGGLLDRSLAFGVGETSRTVTIAINNDSAVEFSETFGLIVQRATSDPVSVFLAKSTFTIADNDGLPPIPEPVALTRYPATGITAIGQGNRDNDDSHTPDGARQWAYDFLAPNLTDVHAVTGGVVVAVRATMAGAFRGYGNVVTIFHDGGFYATYAHLTAFSATVTSGMRIEAGHVIAKSGDSGSLDGGTLHPNLHVQFGSTATLQNARFDDGSTATLIANGSGNAVAPAYFPKLVIRFDQRADTGLSTDSDYFGTLGVDDFTGNNIGNGVFGDAGNDILLGKGGNDILRGGAGADRLVGGSGSDVFAYAAPGEGGDVIQDFSAVPDAFRFNGAAFAGLPAGVLAANQFRAQASNAAQDGDDRFVYRTTDTTLWFDPDGSGTAAPVLLADLQAGAIVTSADIIII